MPTDLKQLNEDITALFERIAQLQAEPADDSGAEGFHRAENVLEAIEHRIAMLRSRRADLDPALGG